MRRVPESRCLALARPLSSRILQSVAAVAVLAACAASTGSAEPRVPFAVATGGADCLARGSAVVAGPDVTEGAFAVLRDPRADTTYDLRGLQVQAYPKEHLLQVRPLAPGGMCITGAKVVGDMPRDLTWGQIKFRPSEAAYGLGLDKAGIAWPRLESGTQTLERSWIENIGDAIQFPRDIEHPDDASLTVRGVYGRHVRDDFIEADGCFPVTIEDTLLDEGFMAFSARPGRGQTSGHVASWTVRDSLFHLGCMADERRKAARSSCAPGPSGEAQSTGGIFKQSRCWGSVDLRNVIFRVDATGANGAANLHFPDGTYEDVTVVWLGPGQYPGTLPSRGVQVTRDETVWDEARARWLAAHGCDAAPDDCAFLHRPD